MFFCLNAVPGTYTFHKYPVLALHDFRLQTMDQDVDLLQSCTLASTLYSCTAETTPQLTGTMQQVLLNQFQMVPTTCIHRSYATLQYFSNLHLQCGEKFSGSNFSRCTASLVVPVLEYWQYCNSSTGAHFIHYLALAVTKSTSTSNQVTCRYA